MPLGTLDRTPPPFFRQGPSALTKLTFFSALAVFLMVADTRFDFARTLRTALATALHPVERTLLVPVQAAQGAAQYLMGLEQAIAGEDAARHALAAQSERAARVEQLTQENTRLRALLGLRPALSVRSQTAEVLYDTPDPYSRKVVIDRGSQQGIAAGSPVLDEHGVLGQVTRVFPYSSEVTLLTDKDAATPVLNTRTQARSAAFGNADAGLELRFMAANSDVQVDDLLSTSGVDGVYPPGVPVGRVVSVERRADTGFAQIALAPLATPEQVRHVLVLEPMGLQMPPSPDQALSGEAAKAAARAGSAP